MDEKEKNINKDDLNHLKDWGRIGLFVGGIRSIISRLLEITKTLWGLLASP